MLRTLVALLVLSTLTGCSSLIDVRPLATGRVDTSAYELRGPTLEPLRREALRLCPQGADILRQTARDQRPELDAGRINLWLNTATQWVTPPMQQAQMMIVCKPSSLELAMAPPELPAMTVEPALPSLPNLPIGPIQPQW